MLYDAKLNELMPWALPVQAVEKFLRGRMHGEGDVMRHLASLGLRLGYEQDPRTEFEFGIHSLAADLRSGVRLLRLTELLTGDFYLRTLRSTGSTYYKNRR